MRGKHLQFIEKIFSVVMSEAQEDFSLADVMGSIEHFHPSPHGPGSPKNGGC